MTRMARMACRGECFHPCQPCHPWFLLRFIRGILQGSHGVPIHVLTGSACRGTVPSGKQPRDRMNITPTRTPGVGHVRWVMCGLLFLATTINYIDRQVIALLKGPLTAEFKFSEVDYAAIVFSFQLAYAIGFPMAGRIMDTLGTRRGFALAVGVWSVAAVAHAAAHWFPGMQVP